MAEDGLSGWRRVVLRHAAEVRAEFEAHAVEFVATDAHARENRLPSCRIALEL